jgi:hypothetical protein
VGVDAAGDAVALWTDDDIPAIQSATLPFGGTWSAVQTISAAGASSPQLAVDPAGKVIAVWIRFDPVSGVSRAEASTLQIGGQWTTPVFLSAVGENAFDPAVAIDRCGNAIAAWSRYNGSADVVQVSQLLAGATSWSTPVDLSDGLNNAVFAQLAFDGAGDASVVWEAFIPNAVIQARSYPFGAQFVAANWTPTQTISNSSDFSVQPQIAADWLGHFIAVWIDETIHEIQSSMLTLGGMWSAPFMISDTFDFFQNPRIAMSPAGYAVVDWDNISLHVIQATTFEPTFPLPPTVTSAKLEHNKFLNITEKILKARWEASPSPSVAYYSIYKGDRIIATTGTLSIETNLGNHCARNLSIAAVNEAGLESLHIPLEF